jgi:hypothetical protein
MPEEETMIMKPWRLGFALSLLAAVGVLAGGCGRTDNKGGQAENKPKPERKQQDHGGWWCDEHGVPEHECSMCDDKVAKECKAKADWCELHERAKSQCFKCDPSLKERFAAKYRAKFNGADPPPITEEQEQKKQKDAKS